VDIHWEGLGNVLLVGLIAGVGLVALFAVGVRLLTQASPEMARIDGNRAGRNRGDGNRPDDARPDNRPLQVLAFVCFGLCTAIAVYGIILLLHK
jgi:hypothetical protein